MKLLTAVVEIEGTAGLVVLAAFAIVFGLVAFLAWMILRNVTASRFKDPATWRFSTNVPLPLSKAAFDRVARGMPNAISRPSLTTDQRQFVASLATTRKKLASGVRLAFIIAGSAVGNRIASRSMTRTGTAEADYRGGSRRGPDGVGRSLSPLAIPRRSLMAPGTIQSGLGVP